MFFGGIFLSVLASYFLWDSYKKLGLYRDSVSWPSVSGEVSYSEAVRYSATSPRYDFLVNYEYEVEGVFYKGNQVALYPISSKHEAQYLADRFLVGKTVKVFYHPADHHTSILLTGSGNRKKYGEVILSIITLAVAVGLMAGGLF